MRKPCDNCPWRTDAPRAYWDPQHFLDIYRECQDDGTHMMLCHKMSGRVRTGSSLTVVPDGVAPIICQGWARVIGYDAIGVRIAVMRDHVTPAEIADRSVPLFPSFDAMLAANGIDLPTRNRFRP